MKKSTLTSRNSTPHRFGALLLAVAAGANAAAPVDVGYREARLSVHASGAPLNDVLAAVSAATGIEFLIVGETSAEQRDWAVDAPVGVALDALLADYGRIVVENDVTRPLPERVYVLGTPGTGASSGEIVALRSESIATDLTAAKLEDALRYRPPADRLRDIDRLTGRGDDETVAELALALRHDPDVEVRGRAVEALRLAGSDAAAAALESGLGDLDPALRGQIVRALTTWQNDDSAMALGRVLIGDPDPAVRAVALEALGSHRSERASIFIAAATEDADTELRGRAAELLQDHGE